MADAVPALRQFPPPPQPPPPQPPPPQLPPAAAAASAAAAAAAPPLQPPGPGPLLPPARHASRRRSREARSVRTTIRIISQITAGTITMTTTIIRMLVTTHPLANRAAVIGAIPGSFRASTPMRTSSWVLVLVGYRSRRLLVLAAHHCSTRAVGGGFYASTYAGRARADQRLRSGSRTHQHTARTGTPSVPANCSSDIKPASATAVDTPHGHAPRLRSDGGRAITQCRLHDTRRVSDSIPHGFYPSTYAGRAGADDGRELVHALTNTLPAWTCRDCAQTVYEPLLNAHCTTLEGPATVRISNMALRAEGVS